MDNAEHHRTGVWLLPQRRKIMAIVKEDNLEVAEKVFSGTGLNVTAEGKRHLGAAVGTRSLLKATSGRK